ncbi:MAG TPA: immunity 53 family protein [Verrucomicrobiae bacterium]
MSNVLTKLENWYSQQCNGEWEHGFGIKIETLDNPGWTVDIDLKGTELEQSCRDKTTIERSERDWIICWTQDSIFKGVGGPHNLTEILETFLQWAATAD